MTVYTVKVVSRGQKNTRWQFADGYGNIYDGLLPTVGNYRVGQELDKDSFSSIRVIKSVASVNDEVSPNSIDGVLTNHDAASAMDDTYVNVLMGEQIAEVMTEAEFEASLETEF